MLSYRILSRFGQPFILTHTVPYSMPANARRFQESITNELNIIKDRVQDLIGTRHWGEVGRFKEAILKNVIKRFLPSHISIGTGFIVDSENGDEVSRQLDLIIYDNTYPVLFSEGDFIITTKRNVKAVIEVKSCIRTHELRHVIDHFDESVATLRPSINPRPFSLARSSRSRSGIFFGVFAFEFEGDIHSQAVDRALRESRQIINHVALGPDVFIRKWERQEARDLQPAVDAYGSFYNLYHIDRLAFSYFISNLLDRVSGGLSDRRWFAFPIEGTKEIHRIRTVDLGA
jgi:hypothetical protein